MNIINSFTKIHDELLKFIFQKEIVPCLHWTTLSTLQLLQAYPGGLTKHLLLSELELLFKKQLRNAEMTTKLGQVLLNPNTLHVNDVLKGNLINIDNGSRYQLLDDEQNAMEVIMHRQLSDFHGYFNFLNVEIYPFTNNKTLQNNFQRSCLFTRCKTMQLNHHPIMLPSNLICPVFNYRNIHDKDIIEAIIIPLHHTSVSSGTEVSYTEDALQGILAEIVYMSSIFSYPAEFNTQYRILKLRYTISGGINQNEEHNRTKKSRPNYKITFLILYDDQVTLANLLREEQSIWIYRPYLMRNTEEILFGSIIDRTNQSFSHTEVARRADILTTLINSAQAQNDEIVDFHLLYGCTTVVCLVENLTTFEGSTNGNSGESDPHRQSILAKYKLKQSENYLIDFSKSKQMLDPCDALAGMYGVSLFAQIIAISTDTLFLVPLICQQTTNSCTSCSSGVYRIKPDQLSTLNNLSFGDILYISGLQIQSISTISNYDGTIVSQHMRRLCSHPHQSCTTYRSLECTVDTSSLFIRGKGKARIGEIINVSRLVGLVNAPSLFPTLTLLDLQNISHLYSTISCVNAYIALTNNTNNANGTGIVAKLYDGSTSLFAHITKNTVSLSSTFDVNRLMKLDPLCKLPMLQQYTCLVLSYFEDKSGTFQYKLIAIVDVNSQSLVSELIKQ